MEISAHNVTNVRIERHERDGVAWLHLYVTTASESEEGITLFLAGSLKDKSVAEIFGLAAPVAEPEPQS